MNRRLSHRRDMGRMRAAIGRFDRIYEAAGPAPSPGAQIVPCNGGYELQVAALLMNGTWAYAREAWSRNRDDMVQAARLRGWDDVA